MKSQEKISKESQEEFIKKNFQSNSWKEFWEKKKNRLKSFWKNPRKKLWGNIWIFFLKCSLEQFLGGFSTRDPKRYSSENFEGILERLFKEILCEICEEFLEAQLEEFLDEFWEEILEELTVQILKESLKEISESLTKTSKLILGRCFFVSWKNFWWNICRNFWKDPWVNF